MANFNQPILPPSSKATLISTIAMMLLIIGSLNLGVLGFMNYNFIQEFFGSTFAPILYALVGASGIYTSFIMLSNWFKS